MCNEKDLLVGYLYDDVTAEERRAFEAHLRTCDACVTELDALRTTRVHLSTWAPPEQALGFRIVRDAAEAPSNVVPFRRRWMPAFGLAAAAVLVLAAATAIANLEVRYDNDGFVVRTGWARGAAPVEVASAPVASAPAVAPVNARAEFAALEARLDQMEKVLASRPATRGTQVAASRGMSDAEMLRQVRAIVSEAESRQQVAVAQRLLQVITDLDRRHRADVAALQQGIGQYQGVTDMQIMNTRQAIDELKRVAAREK